MTKESSIHLRRIYGIILSISIVLAGICLIAGCISIYNSGDQPYSRESVADTFSAISVPVYLCLALTVVGFVLELTLPSAGKPQKHVKDYNGLLNRMKEKKDLSKCEGPLLDSINRERRSRRIHSAVLTVLLAAASAVFLVYSLNSGNFHQSDINGSVIRAMRVLIPCASIPFVYAVFTLYRNEKSLQREIGLMKQVPAAEASEKPSAAPRSLPKRLLFNLPRLLLLFAAIAIIIYGYFSGGTADVLTKAINICTECIGLG